MGHTPAPANNPGKRRKVEEGPRGEAPGPELAGSEMPWEGISRGGGGEGLQGLGRGDQRARGARRQECQEQDPGDRAVHGREGGGPQFERAEVKPRSEESCSEFGDEQLWSESQLGMVEWRDGGRAVGREP